MNVDKAKSLQIKKTWKPTAAGILDLMLGCLWLLVGLFLFLLTMACDSIGEASVGVEDYGTPVLLVVAGILAIIGGKHATQRNKWRFALVGSVAALLPAFISLIGLILYQSHDIGVLYPQIKANNSTLTICGLFLLAGIEAMVLTALSKKEFEQALRQPTDK